MPSWLFSIWSNKLHEHEDTDENKVPDLSRTKLILYFLSLFLLSDLKLLLVNRCTATWNPFFTLIIILDCCKIVTLTLHHVSIQEVNAPTCYIFIKTFASWSVQARPKYQPAYQTWTCFISKNTKKHHNRFLHDRFHPQGVDIHSSKTD